MKGLAILLVTFYLAQTRAERDWSKITPVDIDPFGLNLKEFNITTPRIVGGNEAVPHSYPHQAALFITIGEKTAFCGGSIISSRFILTAAHCVDKTKRVEVVLGGHNIHKDEPTQQRIIATEFIIHKGWSSLFLRNDIALVKLSIEIIFNEHIKPIPLPCVSEKDKTLVGENATVSGWGKDSDKAPGVSPVLRYVTSEIISRLACNIPYLGMISKDHVCIKGRGGKGACSGDSGGPLIVTTKDGRTFQCGIVSFGIAFGCEKGWPSVFTRVTSYVEWIGKNTGISTCA